MLAKYNMMAKGKTAQAFSQSSTDIEYRTKTPLDALKSPAPFKLEGKLNRDLSNTFCRFACAQHPLISAFTAKFVITLFLPAIAEPIAWRVISS